MNKLGLALYIRVVLLPILTFVNFSESQLVINVKNQVNEVRMWHVLVCQMFRSMRIFS